MARTKTPAHVEKLVEALRTGLRRTGVRAEIAAEPIEGTRLYRVFVIAPTFRTLWFSERQILVWSIAKAVLTQEEQFLIASIHALTRQEYGNSRDHGPRSAKAGTRT